MPLRRHIVVFLTACALTGLGGSTTALASENVSPSSASLINVGVPFSGTWYGTPIRIRNEYDESDPTHWWRLAPVLRVGDTIQVAVDASQTQVVNLCLASPVDDYGAADALSGCGRGTGYPGAFRRLRVPYNGTTGQPFLVVDPGYDEAASDPSSGSYTVTIEKVITRVNIGTTPSRRVRRSFTYRAALRYGDNTPAADGTGGVLQWKRAGAGKGPRTWAKLAGARSTRGMVTFRARVPKRIKAKRKFALRSCVLQPGGGPRCTRGAAVKVR